jgi:hypothetical protein
MTEIAGVERRTKQFSIITHPMSRWPLAIDDPVSDDDVVVVVAGDIVFVRLARLSPFRKRCVLSGVACPSVTRITRDDGYKRCSGLSGDARGIREHARMRRLPDPMRKKPLRTLPSVSCYWPLHRSSGAKANSDRDLRAASQHYSESRSRFLPTDGRMPRCIRVHYWCNHDRYLKVSFVWLNSYSQEQTTISDNVKLSYYHIGTHTVRCGRSSISIGI